VPCLDQDQRPSDMHAHLRNANWLIHLLYVATKWFIEQLRMISLQ